jgi:hypothetical protein
LSQPLAALLTREEPDAGVGDVLTAVPSPPTDGLDGGGPAIRLSMLDNWGAGLQGRHSYQYCCNAYNLTISVKKQIFTNEVK